MFFTPWAYVDHVLIQPGGDTGTRPRYPDMSEAYYVISGDGSVTVNGETVAIKKGDAIPVDLDQAKSFKARHRAAGADDHRRGQGHGGQERLCRQSGQ